MAVHDVTLESRTTLLLQNIPTNYTRTMMLGVFNTNGFTDQYDFVFVPMDARTNLNLGYAIINLINPMVTAQFIDTFNGFSRWWRAWGKAVCEVSWNQEEQGLDALVAFYKNSPLLDDLVPDEFKPIRLLDGVRIPFPPPTDDEADEAEEPQAIDVLGIVPAMPGLDALQEMANIARQEANAEATLNALAEGGDATTLGDRAEARLNAPISMLTGDMRTTLVMKNLPGSYSREMLLGLFDNHGFMAQYDFIFLPIDFKTFENQGYCYINFRNPLVAAQFMDTFQGFDRWWRAWCTAACEVSWSKFEQGYDANIERYRNSPVMHETVPDMFKPAVFWNGVRQPFPPATKKVRAPRSRTFPGKIGGDFSPLSMAGFPPAYVDAKAFNPAMVPFGLGMPPFSMAFPQSTKGLKSHVWAK